MTLLDYPLFLLMPFHLINRFWLTIIFLFSFECFSLAQNDVWTLQNAIQYAREHNLSIQQNDLNKRLAELTLLQSKLSQIPNVNAYTGYGRSFGRSIDPTSNSFANSSYDYLTISGSADVLLFGWFQKRNTIAKNSFSLQAAKADLEQLQNDVSLNVATGFLRALLAKEQIKISQKQVDLSKAQLYQTVEFVKAGRLPELNAAQLESQLANDSTNLINSLSVYNSSMLDIKALLNLDFATPFNIQEPQVNLQDQINLASLNPEIIYSETSKHFAAVRSSELRIEAARKGLSAAKGNMLPSLSVTAQFGSNYATSYSQVTGYKLGNPVATEAFVKVDSTEYLVYQPSYTALTKKIPFNNQISNNFRQTLTFGVNFPLFNGWQANNFRKQSELNLQISELNRDQTALKLKQDVYKAYNEATNAFQKYQSAQRAVDAARRAYDFAQKRYELGLTNTVEYLTTQNNQFISESNLLSAKYDLIFKLKVIDYYLGKELKL